MGRFKKKLIVLGSIGIVIAGGLGYNLLNKPNNFQVDQNKKEMIAMYIQDEEGNYQTNNTKEFPKEGYVLNLEKSTCKNGGILSQDPKTKVISLKVSHADACNLYFDKEEPKITTGEEAIKQLGIKVNATNKTTGFETPATTDETANGLFSMEDDYGTSYYFRGAVENNYVKFGKNSSERDMYWRIIRFNGDGSIRMIYDGTFAHANGFSSTDRVAVRSKAWISNSSDAKYVGYMFGGANGAASISKEEAQTNETASNIKGILEDWYKTNIVDTGYGSYIQDAIFCNDRSTPGKSETGWTDDTGLGYGTNATGYGAMAREGRNGTNYESPKPTFVCPQDNDKFTVDAENGGNGNSTYPVGLITADEIVAAGSGKYATANSSYYLYKGSNSSYWSFSPYGMLTNGSAFMFIVGSNGNLYNYYVSLSSAVAPVINLGAEYLNQLEGTGTASDPFRLSTGQF